MLIFYLDKKNTSEKQKFVLIPWCPSNSMEQNPTLEADNHSATEEVLRLLFNHKVHYRIHRSIFFKRLYPLTSSDSELSLGQ